MNKFNVGDKIFSLTLYCGNFVPCMITVKKIEFGVEWVYNGEYIESKCFATCQECSDLCVKLNQAIRGVV
jgi:hypothetical protein